MNTAVIHSTPIWLPQTQTWMYNQIRYLPNWVDAHVVCRKTENFDQFGLANIHCLADESPLRRYRHSIVRRLSGRKRADYLIYVARAVGAQIIHSHFGSDGWANLEAARLARAKHVVTFYGIDVNHLPLAQPTWRDRYRELFSAVDLVLCEGPHMGECIASLGCPQHKIRVHRLGVAFEDIPFRPPSWRAGEPLRILMAAAFREKKGFPYALEALGRLKGQVPFQVTVIGDAPAESPEKQKILDSVTRLGLGESVEFLGFQSHARMLAAASRHHVFLSPSVTAEDGDTEGGAPVSLIEMSAAGMLVVSTTHCDIPQVVIHGETGLLVGERDVNGFADAISWLVGNPKHWDRMRNAARRHVETNFNARTQGELLGKIYSDLATSR